MRKVVVALGAVILLVGVAVKGYEQPGGKIDLNALAAESYDERTLFAAELGLQPQTSYSQECCKICRKGKACGDSCIARDKTCRQPPGCACDG